MPKPGAYLLKRARAIQWAFVKRAKWRLLLLPLTLVPSTVIMVLLLPGHAEFVYGAALATTCWVMGWALFNLDGSRNLRDGASGEELTAGVLKRLTRANWTVDHNVPLDGRDIDHALVGPPGAVAVETKFTNAEWIVTDTNIEEVTLSGGRRDVGHLIACARRVAHDLRLVIRARPGRLWVDVLPLLVLWGPRVHDIPGGARMVQGVLVAIGRQAKEWLPEVSGTALGEDELARARASIRARIAEHVDRAA
jgi:hypothetical protein